MAAINVPKTGIEVAVTRIAFGTGKYRPNGTETSLQHEMMWVTIAGGGKVSPTQVQVHAEAIAPVGSPFWCSEIGFYAGDTLFAIYSKPDQPILYFADDSVTTVSYTLGLTALPADSVTVLVDPNVNTAIQLIGAHETAGDSHPQYLTEPRGDAFYVKKAGDVMGPLSVAAGKADPARTSFALEIREATRATDTNGRDISYAPKMVFHWGGVCVSQLRLTADNVLEVVAGDGASYGALQVGSINVTSAMTIGGQSVWHQGNFDPSSKQNTIGYVPARAAATSSYGIGVDVSDRERNVLPKDRDFGLYPDFANNSADGLNDGGITHGRLTFRQYGDGTDFSGGPAHQLGFSVNGNLWYRNGTGVTWNGWNKFWHSGNFDPASKQNKLDYTPVQQGTGIGQLSNLVKIGWANDGLKATVDVTDLGYVVFGDRPMRMRWAGQPGQPPWLLGGSGPGDICAFNPAELSVKNATNAGGAQTAEKISNSNSYMQLQWSDPGGQPAYLWGSDGPTAARLAAISNLSVGNARTWSGMPLRYAENPLANQPYYILGIEAGHSEFSIYNRTALAVGSCVAAMYANQLSGQGLQHGGVGGYILNKRKDGTGLAGIWEQRGQVYDYGSGAVEGNESSSVLWQRVA
ncbi:hypothetical protein [Collimonas humicola]|uniref:hypothetical protein n=1 Tax=Collimonas humicola TaxID=2825886 RepID=UPI001B8B471E|nr:hypothetical protein [Collimonas humicola]